MLSDPVLRREVAPRRKRLGVSVVSGLFCVVIASLVGATIAVAVRSHAVLTFDLPPFRRFDRPPVSRTSRIVPWIHNGKAVGFKMYANRPGSPPDLIGHKNGDVVQKILHGDPGREIHVDLLRRVCPVSPIMAVK
jgi:hypothetical protein